MGKLHMSRRDFVKVSVVTGAAFGISALAEPSLAVADDAVDKPVGGDIKRIRTGCRGCGQNECGVIAVVQNGRVVRMEGDPTAFQSMGNCCTKSQAAIQAAYHPDRLHYPMKRTNDKESDDPGWVRISWDEAMTTIVSKFDELQARYGGESLFGMCGTSRVWCMFGASNGMYLWDSPNIVQAWQICKGPRHFATLMCSSFADSWMETVAHPDVYVAWGGASEMSNYDDSCRTTVDVATRSTRTFASIRAKRTWVKRRTSSCTCDPVPMGRWRWLGRTSSLKTICTTSCSRRSGPTVRFSCAKTWSRPAGPRLRPLS